MDGEPNKPWVQDMKLKPVMGLASAYTASKN